MSIWAESRSTFPRTNDQSSNKKKRARISQGRTEVHGKGVGRDLQRHKFSSQNVACHTSTSGTTLENEKGSSHVVFMIQEDPSRRLAREGV